LSLTARIERNDGGPDVRIGFTVARRFARASVHRSLVKRVLREAARHAWQPLAAVGRGRLDVMLRLRADFPTAQQCSLPAFRRQLRAEADQLLDALVRQLATESTA
jgi:RNase P protein component